MVHFIIEKIILHQEKNKLQYSNLFLFFVKNCNFFGPHHSYSMKEVISSQSPLLLLVLLSTSAKSFSLELVFLYQMISLASLFLPLSPYYLSITTYRVGWFILPKVLISILPPLYLLPIPMNVILNEK